MIKTLGTNKIYSQLSPPFPKMIAKCQYGIKYLLWYLLGEDRGLTRSASARRRRGDKTKKWFLLLLCQMHGFKSRPKQEQLKHFVQLVLQNQGSGIRELVL